MVWPCSNIVTFRTVVGDDWAGGCFQGFSGVTIRPAGPARRFRTSREASRVGSGDVRNITGRVKRFPNA